MLKTKELLFYGPSFIAISFWIIAYAFCSFFSNLYRESLPSLYFFLTPIVLQMVYLLIYVNAKSFFFNHKKQGDFFLFFFHMIFGSVLTTQFLPDSYNLISFTLGYIVGWSLSISLFPIKKSISFFDIFNRWFFTISFQK